MTRVIPDGPEDLDNLLRANGIDTSEWGGGRSKTVADLWAEIAAGETQLQSQPFRRAVLGVVEIIIRQGDRILIEARQEFQSGLKRQREIPPSEKMKPGETYLDTAFRGVREEFGVTTEAIEVIETSYQTRQEMQMSPSYPGLESLYTFHTVDVRVRGLPTEDFSTDEYSEDSQILVVTHYWTWEPASVRNRGWQK